MLIFHIFLLRYSKLSKCSDQIGTGISGGSMYNAFSHNIEHGGTDLGEVVESRVADGACSAQRPSPPLSQIPLCASEESRESFTASFCIKLKYYQALTFGTRENKFNWCIYLNCQDCI